MKNLFKQKAPGPRPQQPGRLRACLNQTAARVQQLRSALRRHPRPAEDVPSSTLPSPQTAGGTDDGVQLQAPVAAAKVVTNAVARRAMQQKRGHAAKVRAILELAVETENFFARLAIGQLSRDPILSLGALQRFLDRRGSLNGLVTRRHVGQGWCLTMPLLLPPTIASTYPTAVREVVGAMAIQRVARCFVARRALWKSKAGWADKIEPLYAALPNPPNDHGPQQQTFGAFLTNTKAAQEARARALVAVDWIAVMEALMLVVRRKQNTARFITLARGLRRSIARDVAKEHKRSKKAEAMRVRNLQRNLAAYLFEWRKSTMTTKQHRDGVMPVVDTMAKGKLYIARLLTQWRLEAQQSKSARREAERLQYVRALRLESDTKLAMAETQRCETALLSRIFVAWMRETKNAEIARLKASLEQAMASAVTGAGVIDPVSAPLCEASLPYTHDVINMINENEGTCCNNDVQATATPDLNEASMYNNNEHTRRENRRRKKGGKMTQQQDDDSPASPPEANDLEPFPQDAHHTVAHETRDDIMSTHNHYTDHNNEEEEGVQSTSIEERELPVPLSTDGTVGVAGEEGEEAHQGGALVPYVEAALPPLLGNEEEVLFDRDGKLRHAPQSVIDQFAQLENQTHRWLHHERSQEVCPFVRAPLYRLWERDGANLAVWLPASGLAYTPVPSVQGYMDQADSAWARQELTNVRDFWRMVKAGDHSFDTAFEVYTDTLVDVNVYTTTVTRQTGDALDALCAMCCGALAAKHKGQYQLFLATFGDTDARDAYLNNASAQLAPYTQAYTELGATFSTPPERLALNYMEGMLHFPARRQALEASYNMLNTPTKRVMHALNVLLAVCPRQTWCAYRWLLVRQVLCLLGLETLVPLQPNGVPMKRRPTDETTPQFLDPVPPLEADDVFVKCSSGASLSVSGRLFELGLELSRLDEDVQARAHALSTLDDDLRHAELTLHDVKRKKHLTEEQKAKLQKQLRSGSALRAYKDLSMQLKEGREREEQRQELHSLVARQFCSWAYEVVLSHTIEQLLVQDNVVLVPPRMPLAYQVLGLTSYEVLKDWVGRGARKLQPKRPEVKVRTPELTQTYNTCSALFIACKGAMDDPALRLAADSTHWQDVLQVCEAEYNVDWGFGFHSEGEPSD